MNLNWAFLVSCGLLRDPQRLTCGRGDAPSWNALTPPHSSDPAPPACPRVPAVRVPTALPFPFCASPLQCCCFRDAWSSSSATRCPSPGTAPAACCPSCSRQVPWPMRPEMWTSFWWPKPATGGL